MSLDNFVHIKSVCKENVYMRNQDFYICLHGRVVRGVCARFYLSYNTEFKPSADSISHTLISVTICNALFFNEKWKIQCAAQKTIEL